jgi:hypothetical protein
MRRRIPSEEVNLTTDSLNEPKSHYSPAGLQAQLSNVVNRCAYEDTVVWAIFGTFWAANALLLVALFSQGDFPKKPAAAIVISTVGMVVSVAWFLIQRRAIAHLARYEAIIAAIEAELRIPEAFRLTGDEHREGIRGVGVRKVMCTLTVLALVSWGVSLIGLSWAVLGQHVPW